MQLAIDIGQKKYWRDEFDEKKLINVQNGSKVSFIAVLCHYKHLTYLNLNPGVVFASRSSMKMKNTMESPKA